MFWLVCFVLFWAGNYARDRRDQEGGWTCLAPLTWTQALLFSPHKKGRLRNKEIRLIKDVVRTERKTVLV